MRSLLIALVGLGVSLIVSGCGSATTGGTNRDIVMRYVENNEENESTAEVYRQLANIIVNRESSGGQKIVDYEASETKRGQEKEVEEVGSGDARVPRENETDTGNTKDTKPVLNASTDGVDCDFALESGIYISGRDFPSGPYLIGFKTTNHNFYSKILHDGLRIQPGSMKEKDGVYWYNIEFENDMLVSVEHKAYFVEGAGTEWLDDTDMSEESYYNMSEVELLWLSKAGKHPEVEISDARIIKSVGSTTYVLQYSGGMVLAEFEEAQEEKEGLEVKGRLNGGMQVGEKQLGRIKVYNDED